jgi:hypothetical protein
MVGVEEIGKEDGQIRFGVAVLETTQLRPNARVRTEQVPYELTLSPALNCLPYSFLFCLR